MVHLVCGLFHITLKMGSYELLSSRMIVKIRYSQSKLRVEKYVD